MFSNVSTDRTVRCDIICACASMQTIMTTCCSGERAREDGAAVPQSTNESIITVGGWELGLSQKTFAVGFGPH